jgi:hypothetical protein
MRWKALTAAVVSTVVGVGCVVAASPAAAQDTADVYVVHGVPDTPVDVYVDGKRAIDDFQPGTVEGPVPLPAGKHDVALFPADAADGSGDPVLQASAEVPAGGSVTLAAHLDAGGQPKITPFVNDVSQVPAGKARVVVRHLAAAPAVDVRAGGTPVIEGLTNPNEKALEVDAGTVPADVTLAGTDTVAIGPADLDLAEGSATFVHAIGSAEAKNLALVPFTVTGLHSAPSGVPAGSGPAPTLWVLLAVAGAGIVVGGLWLRPRRRVLAER